MAFTLHIRISIRYTEQAQARLHDVQEVLHKVSVRETSAEQILELITAGEGEHDVKRINELFVERKEGFEHLGNTRLAACSGGSS